MRQKTGDGSLDYKGSHYVAYHRCLIGDLDGNHRKLCIDKLEIVDGKFTPVKMT